MRSKGIFIAATGQNVGKTTTCLGILSLLKKKLPNIGFIKPVGQIHVKVDDVLVDKDVVLFKECFSLQASYQDMSPVLLPSGFTRDFLDNKTTTEALKEKIVQSFHRIAKGNDYTVVEGTGHTGVGSIVGLNNAAVAKILGLDIVIIASGGLGSTFDELTLNFALCKELGVNVRGVILNKVLDTKREMILHYFPKALAKVNIPLLGCIPYNEFLSLPCMKDFEALFETQLISGQEFNVRHFRHTRIVDTSLKLYRDDPNIPNQLIIIAATREDVILATLAKYWNEKTGLPSNDPELGLILTGKLPPRKELLEKIQKAHIPALYTPSGSYRAMQKISHFTAKIRLEDTPKVTKAIDLVEPHLNFNFF